MSAITDPFFFCLLASLVWLPLVFLFAAKVQNSRSDIGADRIWVGALAIAILPLMMAPVTSTLNLSLQQPAHATVNAEPIAFTLPDNSVVAPAFERQAAKSTLQPVASPILDVRLAKQTFIAIYFYGLALLGALALIRSVFFAYKVARAPAINDERLRSDLNRWADRIGLSSKPAYRQCDAISSVCVHGAFRPVILIPTAVLRRASRNEIALMGAHEMAHIKRKDTLLFSFSSALKAVFWFNPFMHVISARAALAAEKAADRLVITSGAERRAYAQCFVNGLKVAAKLDRFAFAPALSFTPFDKRSRKERLEAILSPRDNTRITLAHKAAFGLAGLSAIGLSLVQAAFAVTPNAPDAEPVIEKPAAAASTAKTYASNDKHVLKISTAAAAVTPPVNVGVLTTTPVNGDVTLNFGATPQVLNGKSHTGVDIKAARGTPVRAAGDGKVIAVTSRFNGKPSYGKLIAIDHGHGLVTRYAHLDSFIAARGDTVQAGDVIGSVGSTGRTTGPHLHFEIVKDGAPLDPSPLLTPVAEKSALAASAPAPVLAPAPQPSVAPTPDIEVAPSFEIEPAPRVAPDFTPAPDVTVDVDARLEGRVRDLSEYVSRRFKDMDVFNGENGSFSFHFDGDELEFMDEDFAEELSEKLQAQMEDMDIYVSGLDSLDVEVFGDGDFKGYRFFKGELSEEDRERLMEGQKLAMERAHEAMERVHENAEKARERAMERAERDRERAERDRERARERAEREHERHERRREQEREREGSERSFSNSWSFSYANENEFLSEEEALEMREEAIREAKIDLERELKEIERERKKLKRRKSKQQND